MLRSIDVVAAVIEQDGRFLVTLRPEGTHLGGCWEFPGGKIAPAESHDDALRREIGEELHADVHVCDLLLSTTCAYEDRTVCVHFYRCTLLGVPQPLLGQQMRWVAPDEMATLPFPRADAELIRRLVLDSAR
jgi:mutator protein MutT